jgi:predicted PurR-regulated permease PerM
MAKTKPLIFLSVILAILLPFVAKVAWPFFTPFILASVLAIVMNPVKEWLIRRIHRPGLSAFLITFVTVTVLVVILVFAGFTLSQELTSAYDAFNKSSLEEGGWPALVNKTNERIVELIAKRLPIDKEAIRTEIIDRMKEASAYVLGNVGVAVGEVTNAVIICFLLTIFLYFLLRYGGGWVNKLAALTPLDSHSASRIIRTVHDSVVANLSGVFVVAIGQGFLLGLGFWFVGIHSPVLWGTVGALASIIPVVGAALIWLPVVIAYVVMGSYWKALILGLWCALIVGSLDNVLRPIVVGLRDKQHPMLIALAAIGGTFAFGPLGILLGPLVVSLFAVLLNEMQNAVKPEKMKDNGAS